MFKRARDFLEKLESPVAIIYHKDADGLTSAVLLKRFLENNGKQVEMVRSNEEGAEIFDDTIEELKDFSSVVFTDIPVDQSPGKIKGLDSKIIVIDHHIPSKNLTSKNILHINPRFKDPRTYLPASYLAYRITGLRDFNWIAAVGVLSDYGLKNCKDLIDEVKEDWPDILGKTKKVASEAAVYDNTVLGILSKAIDAAKTLNDMKGMDQSFEVFYSAKDPGDVMGSSLMNYLNTYERELERLKEDFEKNSEYFPETNAYMYILDSDYPMTSTLSTVVSSGRNSAVFIIRKNDSLRISARCQTDQMDVSKFLKEIVGDLGSAGGHENAAGGSIDKNKGDEFLERLREKLTG